jgi:glc operon protein GlcG
MMKDGRVGLATLPGVVAGEGGVPIIAEGNTIGAVGVSGAKGVEDAQCAVEAVTAFVGASK